MSHSLGRGRTVLVVNPSPDLYGADLQMLQTVTALVDDGWRVIVALPEDGELVPRIERCGAEVVFVRFPVLRKSNASLGALILMIAAAVALLPRGVRLVRRLRASLVIVNTVTLPWWLLVGRLARLTTICHLHEAETEARRLVRQILLAPLYLADAVIVISEAARSAMTAVQPRLAKRAHLIYNGVPQPPVPPVAAERGEQVRLAVVGRLSPRKAPHLALEALACLHAAGYLGTLEIAGSTFPGYEWYEEKLRERAASEDLIGHVQFSGYCPSVWETYARADIVLAPSLHEPFGNVVVEAQMAMRPVVASASQGHLESIADGVTGLLVESGSATAMAQAVQRLVEDPELAERLSQQARASAGRRFSVERYRQQVLELVASLTC